MVEKIALNITETAEALSLSRQSIYNIIATDNSFPVFHIGKSVRVDAESLKAWVLNQTQKART